MLSKFMVVPLPRAGQLAKLVGALRMHRWGLETARLCWRRRRRQQQRLWASTRAGGSSTGTGTGTTAAAAFGEVIFDSFPDDSKVCSAATAVTRAPSDSAVLNFAQ